MKIIGQILGGIASGYVLAIILGSVMFQGVFFQQGMDKLGVGAHGFYYFFGGFCASAVLMCFPGARNWKSLMGLYPLVIVAIGSLSLGDMLNTEFEPSGDLSVRLSNGLYELAAGAGMLLFWLAPAIVTVVYGTMYWIAKKEMRLGSGTLP